MIDIMEKFNNYDKEQLKSIIKIYINNPIIDLINTIYFYEQDLKDDEKIIKYDGTENKVIYIFAENEEKVKYYNFSKEKVAYDKKSLNLNEIKYKFYNQTKISVEINKDPDFLKKDGFIKDDKLYISNMLSEENQCLLVIYEYIDILCKDYNSIGVKTLCKEMIYYHYTREEIKLSQVIYNSFEINRLFIFSVAFAIYYKVITTFDKKFLKLNHLIKIDTTEDITKLDVLNEMYGIEEINKIKEDILNDNISEYPYYYLLKGE